jgi:hypothetical protein
MSLHFQGHAVANPPCRWRAADPDTGEATADPGKGGGMGGNRVCHLPLRAHGIYVHSRLMWDRRRTPDVWRCVDDTQGFNLDIPIRDMRLLDTHLSNYETIGQILVRENAIVFSMEHVKAIILADKARRGVRGCGQCEPGVQAGQMGGGEADTARRGNG